MSLPTDSEDLRAFLRPIHRQNLWSYYETAKKAFWIDTEIDMSRDASNYSQDLNKKEQDLLCHILSFFAIADAEVNINILERFRKEIPYIEASYFFDFQVAVEGIHQITYADAIEALVKDKARKDQLFAAVKEIPTIARMVEYIRECVESQTEPLQLRILRMACVEGIFFHGAFCVIYWFRSRGLMPGLGQANELIARDEGLHTDFALELFRMFDSRPTQSEITHIVSGAVDIAANFINGALPEGLPEMNSALMLEYIRSISDKLVQDIGFAPIYGAKNPFSFMDQINMPAHTRFFETRSTQYKSGGDKTTIRYDADI